MPPVWPIENNQERESAPSPRLRSLLPALLIGGFIGGLFFYLGHRPMSIVVWSISGTLFLCGILSPRIFRKIEHVLQIFGTWIGRFMTVLLLVPFYVLVFVPGRLLFKLSGKDPMTRDCPTSMKSYWTESQTIEDPKVHLRRQF